MCACAAFRRIVSKSCPEDPNAESSVFFHLSSVSFVSPLPNKSPEKRVLFANVGARDAERGMPSPAGHRTRSGLCDEVVGMGFCPIWGIWRGAGSPATSRNAMLAPPERERLLPRRGGFSALVWRTAPAFRRCPHVGATWAFACCCARTHSQSGAENRTQR